jgi:hypothetical protein
MSIFETAAHQVAADQRHAAARDAAVALVSAANSTVVSHGQDITRADTVIAFGQSEVADQVMVMAPCGCYDDVLAATVVLVSELALRLASGPSGNAAGGAA